MANPDAGNGVSPAYANTGGPGYKYRKGERGAEHDGPQKDTVTKWPKAGGPRSPSMNKVGFPVIKFRVVSDGVEDGGQGNSSESFKK